LADTHATPSVADAYSELAAGLRGLAASVTGLEAGPLGVDVEIDVETSPDERSAVVVQLLRDAVRGAGEVGACSAALGGFLVLGYNVWVTVSPPLHV
jgi:hypothetical protein